MPTWHQQSGRDSVLGHDILRQFLCCHAQKEVLEELEHNFPLDLLVELSEAAMATLQVQSLQPYLAS